MNYLTQAARQALEALEGFLADYQSEDGLNSMKHYAKTHDAAIAALRAALEAQQAELVAPFGWAIACNNGTTAFCRPRVTNFFGAIMDREPFEQDDVTRCDREWPGLAPHRLVTLYVHPPAQPQGWVPVTQKMPKSGQAVLACYRNHLGKLRRIRAEWIAAKSVEAINDESDIGEYDEATDTYYYPEGWYERIDNWGDYSSVAVTEGEVTHWQPLPEPPKEPQA